MSSNPMRRSDLSVEFLSWLNTELRRRAGKPSTSSDETVDEPNSDEDVPRRTGLVNRLKAYFICGLSLALFVVAQLYFGI